MAYFAPYIDGSGIHLPTYEDRLTNLCVAYRSVFGRDAVRGACTPDALVDQTTAGYGESERASGYEKPYKDPKT